MKYQVIKGMEVVGGARTLAGAKLIVREVGGVIYRRVST